MSIKKGMPQGFLGTHDGLPSDDLLESINAVTGKLDEKNSMGTEGTNKDKKKKTLVGKAVSDIKTFDKGFKVAKEDVEVDETVETVEEETDTLVSEEFGEGVILSVNEDTVEIMFEHGIETVSFEQLDELSKEKLGQYINKSANQAAINAMQRETSKDWEKANKHKDKASKRLKGVATATKKLTKEEAEAIDELSNDTLKTYVTKANDDITNKAKDFLKKDSTKDSRKAAIDAISKRNKGIGQARSKMTEETISESTDNLSKVKAKLENIYRKEVQAKSDALGKLHGKLHDQFHKEAPEILAKHGYKKVADSDKWASYVKGHDDGHMSAVALHKHKADHHTSYGPYFRTGHSNVDEGAMKTRSAHDGVYDESDFKKHKKEMMPNFEHEIINTHKY